MKRLIGMFCLSSLLIASSLTDLGSQSKAPKSETPFEKLQKEVAALKKEVATLRATNLNISFRTWQLQFKLDAYQKAELDLSIPKKYQRLDTETASFLISVEEAVQYLDGYKVVLNIGNPYAADFIGYKLKTRWGLRLEKSLDKWEKSIREKETSFTEALLSGVWNRVEIILPATTADQLGFLEISLVTNLISLRPR